MALIGSYLKDEDGNDIIESLKTEFKQFCFTTIGSDGEKIFNTHDIKQYIDGDYSTLNEKTKETIITYMKKYIRKYFTTFGNTEEIDEGHFYIGIDDDGKISGIPAFDSMENMTKIIYHHLIKNISDALIFQFDDKGTEYIEEIEPIIRVELIELEEDSILLDDMIEDIVSDYIETKKSFDQQFFEYKKKRKEWCDLITYEKRSIRIMINEEDSRIKLIKYMQEYTMKDYELFFERNIEPKLCKKSKEEVDDIMIKYHSFKENLYVAKSMMISKLISSGEIIFDTDEIVHNRYNIYHFSFWNSQFKDMVVDKLQEFKPEKKYFIAPNTPYFIIKNDFSLLSKRIMDDGKRNFFYVKITLPTKETLSSIGIKDSLFYCSDGKIKIRTRKVCHDGSPCCL